MLVRGTGRFGATRLALVCALVASGAASAIAIAPAQERFERNNTPVGRFAVTCAFSHQSHDDPIVFSGDPGAAHQHQFFGSRTTDAFSTARRLRRSRTTCNLRADRAGYWTPALLIQGRAVRPLSASIYYSNHGKEAATVRPFPKGLKVIAGDSHATSPQGANLTAWGCEYARGRTARTLPAVTVGYYVDGPHCKGRERVVLSVSFPDCWDGRRLDSRDHQSHMAYARVIRGIAPILGAPSRICPRSHPVPVPRMAMNVRYPTNGAATGAELSSGGIHSGHADFFNGWFQPRLRRLVHDCINRERECAHGELDEHLKAGPTSSPPRA